MRSLLILVAAALVLTVTSSFQPEGEWTPFLDKNLSKWEIYQSFRHKLGYKGEAPKDEQGNLIKPIGYNVNEGKVFSVMQQDGDLVLHIDGDIYGCLFTKEDLGNYDLKFKMKWGTHKYVPRVDEVKDSGVLYNSQGPCGVEYWRTWMLSQEFQVTEAGMGDFWSQASSREDVKAVKKGKDYFFDNDNGVLTPFGSGTGNGGFCHAGVDAENKDGWNEMELINYGGKSIRIVNGKVVMALSNSRYVIDGQEKPLTHGKIQVQSECAEVFYKDILIKKIDGIPGEYEKYFK